MQPHTIIVDQYRSAAHLEVSGYAYQGLRIHALAGLHELVAEQATRHFAPGGQVLDLAAGSGAMCARLRDLGFVPTAVDYVAENFRLPDVPLVIADLNTELPAELSGRFQGVVAAEIIEHLENPRHFLRLCRDALQPGGKLILSTPNLQSPSSQVMFLRSGVFAWFRDEDYRVQGHITPLSPWQLRKCVAEAGLQMRWSGSVGDGLRMLSGSPRLKLVGRLFDMLSGAPSGERGEVFVLVAEKPPNGS